MLRVPASLLAIIGLGAALNEPRLFLALPVLVNLGLLANFAASLRGPVSLVEGIGPGARLRVLRSHYGHDAFLKETDRIDALLAAELHGRDRAAAVPLPNDPIGVSV